MLRIHSFLRGIYSFVKAISKKSYRTCAIITAGVAIVSLISLNSNEFGGSGKNKVKAANHSVGTDMNDDEGEESDAEAKIQENVTGLLVNTQNFEEYLQSNNLIPEITELEQSVLSKQDGIDLNVKAGITENITGTDLAKEDRPEEIQKDIIQSDIQEDKRQDTKSVIARSDEDYDTLLRIVEAEATGEDITGKLLVANVILNRVNSDGFPDTVYEVVFQKNSGSVQFSPTIDGRFSSVKITDDTVKAVERALDGEDMSQGALYFSARSKADPSNMNWFDRNLEWLFEYGGHEFYTTK